MDTLCATHCNIQEYELLYEKQISTGMRQNRVGHTEEDEQFREHEKKKTLILVS